MTRVALWPTAQACARKGALPTSRSSGDRCATTAGSVRWQMPRRGAEGAIPEQALNRRDINAEFDQVSREGMPESVHPPAPNTTLSSSKWWVALKAEREVEELTIACKALRRDHSRHPRSHRG